MRWVLIGAISTLVVIAALLGFSACSIRRALAYTGIAWLAVLAITHEPNAWSAWPSVVAMLLLGFITVLALTAEGSRQTFFFSVLGVTCGVATNIRIGNAFVLVGLLTALAFQLSSSRTNALRNFICLMLGLGIGCAPTIASNWINAGSPLSTTYDVADASYPRLELDVISDNIWVYSSRLWTFSMQMIFITAAIGSIIWHRRIGTLITSAIVANLFFSIAYYLTHEPSNSYYALPIAAWGSYTFLFAWSRSYGELRVSRAGFLAGILTSIVISCFLVRLNIAPEQTFRENVNKFPSNSIVWASDSAGFLVYFDAAYSAKIDFATLEVADALIEAIAKTGMGQYFVADAPKIKEIADRRRLQRYDYALGHPVFVYAPLRD